MFMQLKDAGSFEALFTGKVTEIQRIDVMERIIALERLNPTPRPTTQVVNVLNLSISLLPRAKDLFAFFSFPGPPIQMVDGILSGLGLGVQLLLNSLWSMHILLNFSPCFSLIRIRKLITVVQKWLHGLKANLVDGVFISSQEISHHIGKPLKNGCIVKGQLFKGHCKFQTIELGNTFLRDFILSFAIQYG